MRGSPSPEPVDEDPVGDSEDDRARRQVHRQNGVDGVRNKPDYLFLVALWNQGGGGGAIAPPAPTHRPEDVATVSKRTWEKGMKEWRNNIRSLAVQHGYVHLEAVET